jgi:hypothetical protein
VRWHSILGFHVELRCWHARGHRSRIIWAGVSCQRCPDQFVVPPCRCISKMHRRLIAQPSCSTIVHARLGVGKIHLAGARYSCHHAHPLAHVGRVAACCSPLLFICASLQIHSC